MLGTSSLIIKHNEGFGGKFVDSPYLGASYETANPYYFSNTLTRVFSSTSRFWTGKPLQSLTDTKFGSVEIDKDVYRWRLQGADYKMGRSLENLEAGNAAPGLYNSTFRIKLDLDYYSNPDVLLGEHPEFALEIVDGPMQDGNGYIYTVRLQGDNPNQFFPPQYLEPGMRFSKGWTTVQSEMNSMYGSQQYPASFMLESQLSAFAQQVTITDKAWREEGNLQIEFGFTDGNGKWQSTKSFLSMAEAKMYDELYLSMEAQLWLGKKQTRPADQTSVYWKKTGPGVREQLKDGWIQRYSSSLSTKLLQEYLMTISHTRIDEAHREFAAASGQLGSYLFHNILASEARSLLSMDTNWIERKGMRNKTPEMAYGVQFTEYRGPLGINFKVMNVNIYDDNRFDKRVHPLYPQFSIDSARMTYLDFGANVQNQGGKNIQVFSQKDTFYWGYQAGTWTPTGPVKGGQASVMVNGYTMFVSGTKGIVIFDVTRCGELIFDID